jgi:non-canonical (house-cleaning) NTP pyrophosphatase
LRDWYAPEPHEAQKPVGQKKLEWVDVLNAWAAIECDLHEKYGVDVESGVLRQRSWRWLETRIFDLINQPSRLRTALNLTSETTTSH